MNAFEAEGLLRLFDKFSGRGFGGRLFEKSFRDSPIESEEKILCGFRIRTVALDIGRDSFEKPRGARGAFGCGFLELEKRFREALGVEQRTVGPSAGEVARVFMVSLQPSVPLAAMAEFVRGEWSEARFVYRKPEVRQVASRSLGDEFPLLNV